MNPAATELIIDAKLTLDRRIAEGASRDPLVAAFAGWLGLSTRGISSLSELARATAQTKGAARSYRDVAVLGFAVSEGAILKAYGADLETLISWLTGRPLLLAGDPSPVLTDPVALLGIALGGGACLSGNALTTFEGWLQRARAESARILQASGWQGEVAALLLSPDDARVSDWTKAGLAAKLQQSVPLVSDLGGIIRQIVSRTADAAPVEAALMQAALSWASERALTVNFSAVAIGDVIRVLESVGSVFSRWVWEDKPRTKRRGGMARRWYIEHEYHFQSLLFTVLKPLVPQLEEEQYLASTGQVQPRADLCILPLKVLIEVKYWYSRDSVTRLIEEVAADVTLYLKSEAPYRSLVVAIWDESVRTEEHESLKRGLGGLQGVCGVIVINRPSWMGGSVTP